MKIKFPLRNIVLVLICTVSCLLNGQAQDRFSLTGGIGYYELVNAGIQWRYAKRSSISIYTGSNLGVSQANAWSVGLSLDEVFFKPTKWKLKPGFSIGGVYWKHDDELYTFETVTFPFMFLVSYPLSSRLKIRLEGGYAASYVLESDRKQNVQAGFPNRSNWNGRINLVYNLKRHDK